MQQKDNDQFSFINEKIKEKALPEIESIFSEDS